MDNFDFINTNSPIYFILAISSLFLAVVLFKKNTTFSLLLLIIGTFFLGYFVSLLDPFLNLWDEQYHALVAKNLNVNFLEPKLFSSPILDFDYQNWTQNSIWLHKQPLFLWQIALSIKLLGTTELAIRIPSIIMHAILPFFIYRIGKIIYSKETGFYGALFFAFAFFPLELVVGKYSTDHNDMAFLFYLTASFWAWFEWKESQKNYWLILVGIFSGGAVLIKWLMGLLIYVVWFIVKTVLKPNDFLNVKSYLSMIYSFTISLLVFIPWQIYIFNKYPREAYHEYAYNSKHLFVAIEGHSEHFWFHFTEALKNIYGSGFLVPVFLIIGLILLIKNTKNKVYKMAIITTVSFVYVFYTLAMTKMISFTIIASPFVFLSFGYITDKTIQWIESKKTNFILKTLFITFLPLIISYAFLDLSKINFKHSVSSKSLDRIKDLKEQKMIDFIKNNLSEDYVIFNASITLNGQIPTMFYTDCIAYGFVPNEEQIKTVRQHNKKVAIINIDGLPEYISKDKRLLVLNLHEILKK